MHDFYLLGEHITPPVPLVLSAAGTYCMLIIFPCDVHMHVRSYDFLHAYSNHRNFHIKFVAADYYMYATT